MKPVRLAVALAVGATALIGGVSSAAPVKTCNLIKDAQNDTFLLRTQDSAGAYGPQEDALDITGGDIASDSKAITGVLRIKKVALRAGTAPNGLTFRISFSTPAVTAAGRNFYLDGRVEGDGKTVFSAGFRDRATNLGTKLGDATGVVDLKANEVRVTAPLSVFAQTNGGVKPGTVIELADLDNTTSRYTATNPATGGGGTAVFADVAVTDTKYTAGAPSCVAVGK